MASPGDRVLVIIPAYNEESSLVGVVGAIRRDKPNADILIVNDGSTDNTAGVAENLGVFVANLPYNLGIGAAMQTGYLYAERQGYDIAVQVDGDGQHPADQISKVVAPIRAGMADVAIGSRFLGEGDYVPSLARSVGIKTFSLMLSLVTGQKVTDPTSGFRAANRDVIRFYSKYYPDDYPEVEAIVLLRKADFNIMEVPVRMEARVWGRSSITHFHALYYMIKVSLAVFVDLFKKVER